ncbi:NERD domain-containing protein [Lederbergia sp. NSJ-179]|uniref:nuclease-related domain-containing protein n=1 Tax=Lederbergia sp. NSJ-179 TaxID=2931402 RepID=UPI001FD206E2|nr:nuclease-related domain-containing protein [Lederbergia sp. NSJ-179]MCJ7842769.1 NERD domain-containing protein [Lederbergia sp. NSJ-179]
MAQLLKLQDYVSRYETDLSRYPSQFIRLKKQQWMKVKAAWEAHAGTSSIFVEEIEEIPAKSMKYGKLRQLFKRGSRDIEIPDESQSENISVQDKEENLDFSAPLEAQTELELKQSFLDHLLLFQLKWASSTITEKSFVDSRFYTDRRLKHFLQRFPDNYFLFYEPIFLLKKAPVELEVLLLSPTEIWCLSFLEEEGQAVYIGDNQHFWSMKKKEKERKILNPMMSVNRMGKIVTQLFQLYEVNLPIRKAIVSRDGFIDYPDAPQDLTILDQRTYGDWFERARNTPSPIKMMQMRAATALLDYGQSTSFNRPNWELE